MSSYADYNSTQHFTYHYCLTGDCPYNYNTGETNHVKSTETKYDSSQHWTKTTCSGCSWSSEGTKYAHSNWISNGITDKSNSSPYTHTIEYECGGCDYHKTETDNCESTDDGYDKTEIAHAKKYKCKVCGQSMGQDKPDPHDFGDRASSDSDGNIYCAVCGYKQVHTHKYKYDSTYSSNSTSHWINGKCEGCEATTTKDTGSHEQGYRGDEEYTKISGNKTNHYVKYPCPTCGYGTNTLEAHYGYTYEEDGVTAWQHNIYYNCNGCGYSNYKSTKYDQKCTESSGDPVYGDYTSISSTQHKKSPTYTCKYCGGTKGGSTVTESHTWSTYAGHTKCKYCGYQYNSGQYPLEPLSNNVSNEAEKALHDADVVDNSISIESYVDNIETEALVAEDKLKHIILKTDPHEKE